MHTFRLENSHNVTLENVVMFHIPLKVCTAHSKNILIYFTDTRLGFDPMPARVRVFINPCVTDCTTKVHDASGACFGIVSSVRTLPRMTVARGCGGPAANLPKSFRGSKLPRKQGRFKLPSLRTRVGGLYDALLTTSGPVAAFAKH